MKHKIDNEPTWESIINGLLCSALNLKSVKDSLFILADVGDRVRQAQKNDKILVFYPNGTVAEVKKGDTI